MQQPTCSYAVYLHPHQDSTGNRWLPQLACCPETMLLATSAHQLAPPPLCVCMYSAAKVVPQAEELRIDGRPCNDCRRCCHNPGLCCHHSSLAGMDAAPTSNNGGLAYNNSRPLRPRPHLNNRQLLLLHVACSYDRLQLLQGHRGCCSCCSHQRGVVRALLNKVVHCWCEYVDPWPSPPVACVTEVP